METKTTATRIADLFGNDGQNFNGEDGRTLDEVCSAEALGNRAEWRDGYRVGDVRAYRFRDGSGIIHAGGCWDIAAGPDCYCMDGAGHDEECAAE